MLHLIFGRAGSGKTEYIRQLAQDCAHAGTEVTFMVPEQNSFDCERALLHTLGPKTARLVDVLSFTRLGDQVGRAYGGFAGRRLGDSGRVLLMSMALEQVRDRLVLYRKSAESNDFIALLLRMSAACKMASVRPEQFAAIGVTGILRDKAAELALILGAYDALVAEHFVDPLDDPTRLAHQLHEHPFFRGRIVMLDAFKGFTEQQFNILDAVIAQSAECWITLCTDRLDDPDRGTGLFSNVRGVAHRLIECAHRHQVRVAAPVLLDPGKRFCAPALKQLETYLFRTDPVDPIPIDSSVQWIAAADKYAEADRICAEMRRLVREDGYRWRDFTVIVRNESDYQGILNRALRQADIPFFMDQPVDISASPLMAFVLSSLDTAQGHFRSDELFRCLKTGLWGLESDQIAELENYAFLWNIDRDAWLSVWKSHPRGFADDWTNEDRTQLARLEALRQRIIAPLCTLAERTERGTGRELAGAVYDFLTQTDAAAHLRTDSAALESDGEAETGEFLLRLWDLLMELLDQTALVLTHPLDGKRYTRLLELIIRSAKLGELPQSLDEVTVGGADRTRPASPRVVFLAGAVQGIFPASVGTDGLFTESEQRILADHGLHIARPAAEQTVEERFLAYSAACSPSERLYLSEFTTSTGGEGMHPSELISELRRIFPDTAPLPTETPLETEHRAFMQYAAHYHESSAMQSTLRAYFAQDPARADAMRAIARAAEPAPFRFAEPALAQTLFGAHMTLSPSRVELYAHCPFQYFCRYGLNAQERRPAKIDALEYGTLIHYLLERMMKKEWAPGEPFRPTIHQWMAEYLDTHLGGAEGKSDRFMALYTKFEGTAEKLMQYLAAEQAQSAFRPVAAEWTIGKGGDMAPTHIALPDGGSIEIVGKIDRVDYYNENGEAFVRVIDYKTGSKKFSLSDVLYGINLQMLIYLMTLCQNGFKGEAVQPAGILYVPARSPRIEAAHGADEAALSAELAGEMRMNGMVLYDERIIHAMDPTDSGLYIPVKRNKDGSPSATSSLYTMEQFGILSRVIRDELRKMGSALHDGQIPAAPVDNACDYCSFASVCGREGRENTALPSMRSAEAFAALARRDRKEEF